MHGLFMRRQLAFIYSYNYTYIDCFSRIEREALCTLVRGDGGKVLLESAVTKPPEDGALSYAVITCQDHFVDLVTVGSSRSLLPIHGA